MDFKAFQKAVQAQAEALNLKEYELYYQRNTNTSVSVFQQEVKSFAASTDGGVCFRCLVNGKMGYASTQELSEAAAESSAEAGDGSIKSRFSRTSTTSCTFSPFIIAIVRCRSWQ